MPQTPAQRLWNQKQRDLRRALGVCLSCGRERGQGSTPTLCHACRERKRQASQRYNEQNRDKRRVAWREYAQAHRDQSRAAGLCTACGKCAPAPGLALCTLCNQKQQIRDERHRKKKRHARVPRYTGDPKTYPFRLGKERLKLDGKPRVVRVALDAWAYLTIRKHLEAMRERDRNEGRTFRRDAISLLVRTMILQHEHVPCPVHRQTEEKHEHRLGVSLDDRTVALLDAHAAQHYDGNRSAALRDFLIAAKVPPKWIAGVGGPRRYSYPDEDEP